MLRSQTTKPTGLVSTMLGLGQHSIVGCSTKPTGLVSTILGLGQHSIVGCSIVIRCRLYHTAVEPPNTAALGTGKITAVLENGGKWSHI